MKPVKTVFFLLVLAVQFAKAQDTSKVVSANMFDKFTDQVTLADRSTWVFRPGNDSNWARPDIDNAGWIKINPAKLSKKFADKNGRVEGWFRIKLKFDSSLLHKELWIDFVPWTATKFYIDGKLMATRGNTGDNGKPFEEYNGDHEPLAITFNSDTVHNFAIHFVSYLSPFPPHHLKYQLNSNDLLTIFGPNPFINTIKFISVALSFINTWMVVCATLSLLFWLLAFQNPREKNLVWIALCTTLYTVFTFAVNKSGYSIGLHYTSAYVYFEISYVSMSLLFIFIPFLLTRVFKRKTGSKFGIFLAALFLLNFFRPFFDISILLNQLILIVTILILLSICLYYIISSWKKLQGAQWAIVVGLFFSLLTLFAGFIYAFIGSTITQYFIFLLLSFFLLSFPVSLLVYVSMRFREIIHEVRVNADKVVKLSEEKRIQAEKQQQILQEEVNRQTAEIRQTLDNLKATQKQLIQSEKMASLGELTAGIAHEIQNPLNFVNNFSEVNKELIDEATLANDAGNADEVKGLLTTLKENEDKITHHGKRADAIVKGMLQHSRASSGKKEPTDINALADEYLRLSYHGLKAKDKDFNATMKTDIDETIGTINIIPQDIGRVLLNLYNNAFYSVTEKKKQQPENYEPTVSVSTKKINDKVEIRVKDNGNGIPQKVVDKIFQPFFTTKPTGVGTGLGLSLSYDIVKAHGGEIKVASKEGEGTTFIIELASK